MQFPPLEVEILQSLQHPRICQVREVIVGIDDVYLVTDFIPCGTLLAYCRESKQGIGEATCRAFMLDIITAVDYIHSRGIVHRDLKPDNFMVDNDWHVCITDFGLAAKLEGETLLDTACGTIEYAAPEIFWGEAYAGRPVDVWSIGVTLFAMATGRLPFRTPNDTVSVIYSWPHGSSASNSLKELVGAIFQVEPANRITIAAMRSYSWYVRSCFLLSTLSY
jgi:serine/threonine protein kinase